jgi:hypothetical protein
MNRLSRKRVIFAFTVAVIADVVQIMLGPVGFLVVDEVLDVAAMVLITWAIGFHPLLLPTFLVELMPFIEFAPTWTACTFAVVMMKNKAAEGTPPPPMEPRSDTGGPVYSETGEPQPAPAREPRKIG